MKDYYAILGVSRTATAEEIKRTYRRLAVMYHPDKNPSPHAEALFKEINEAYDVLGDAEKRFRYDGYPAYDNPPSEPIVTASALRHRDPAYKRRAQPNVKRKSERQQMLEMMARFMPMSHMVNRICIAIAIILFLDFVIPSRSTDEQIIRGIVRRTQTRNGQGAWWVIHTDAGRRVEIEMQHSAHLKAGQSVNVKSTRLLNVTRRVSTDTGEFRITKSIYGNFIFAPAALLILGVLGMYFRNNIEYNFQFAVGSFLVLLLNGVIVLLIY